MHFSAGREQLLKTHSIKYGYAVFACTFECKGLSVHMNIKDTFNPGTSVLINKNEDTYQKQYRGYHIEC